MSNRIWNIRRREGQTSMANFTDSTDLFRIELIQRRILNEFALFFRRLRINNITINEYLIMLDRVNQSIF